MCDCWYNALIVECCVSITSGLIGHTSSKSFESLGHRLLSYKTRGSSKGKMRQVFIFFLVSSLSFRGIMNTDLNCSSSDVPLGSSATSSMSHPCTLCGIFGRLAPCWKIHQCYEFFSFVDRCALTPTAFKVALQPFPNFNFFLAFALVYI